MGDHSVVTGSPRDGLYLQSGDHVFTRVISTPILLAQTLDGNLVPYAAEAKTAVCSIRQ